MLTDGDLGSPAGLDIGRLLKTQLRCVCVEFPRFCVEFTSAFVDENDMAIVDERPARRVAARYYENALRGPTQADGPSPTRAVRTLSAAGGGPA